MLWTELSKYAVRHKFSGLAVALMLVSYINHDIEFIESLLPLNGKFLAMFTIISLAAIWELMSFNIKEVMTANAEAHKLVIEQLKALNCEMERLDLMSSVNQLYQVYIQSGDKEINHVFTQAELRTLLSRWKSNPVNSFTEGRLREMCEAAGWDWEESPIKVKKAKKAGQDVYHASK